MTAPNGMLTSAVGRIVTLARNQACWMNSLAWNGRRGSERMTSRPSANRFPLCRSAPTAGLLIRSHRDRLQGNDGFLPYGSAAARGGQLERAPRRGDVVVPAPGTWLPLAGALRP